MRKHDLQVFFMPEKSGFGGEALYGSMILTPRQGPSGDPKRGSKIMVLYRASHQKRYFEGVISKMSPHGAALGPFSAQTDTEST